MGHRMAGPGSSAAVTALSQLSTLPSSQSTSYASALADEFGQLLAGRPPPPLSPQLRHPMQCFNCSRHRPVIVCSTLHHDYSERPSYSPPDVTLCIVQIEREYWMSPGISRPTLFKPFNICGRQTSRHNIEALSLLRSPTPSSPA